MSVEIPRAVRPQDVPEGVELDHPSLYFNRELGWIDFNWRVLAQAMDPEIPLLERIRYLGITYRNLDEFIQKRVGGLRRQEAAGVLKPSPDGRSAPEQLELIREATREMQSSADRIWADELRPLLREAGFRISGYDDLTDGQRRKLDRYFDEHIYPVATPLAVDPGHPFPFISNLSLSLAVQMCRPGREALHFARLKVPVAEGRWIPVPDSDLPNHYVPVEEVVRRNVSKLFRGMEIISVHPFRVTRNADIRRDEEEAEDLLAMISDEIRERRAAPVVRLEVDHAMPRYVRELLLRELGLTEVDLVQAEVELGLADLFDLADVGPAELRFSPWEPVVPEPLAHEGETEEEQDIFSILRRGDLLVHHPYESFAASVQRLIEEAAADPAVLAIKQTLYRTSDRSPIVNALRRAAERGKEVAVLVEVKARFDEQNNIEWGQMLEQAGVHVTYGMAGLKTHAKALLVIRQEDGQPRAYCHIGTGNYHLGNARLYTDLGLLTCDPAVCGDVVNLFHHLTGYAPDQPYRRVIVAPTRMRQRFLELIRAEIEVVEGGGEGRVLAKMNALDDLEIIRELYRASRSGVRIDLIVRGHCRLRPGLPGYSDNIRVVGHVGRFLEHDRIFWFGNGGEPLVFIGSADWRSRNLDDRVEAIVPIEAAELRDRLTGILEVALADNVLAWELRPDGRWLRRAPAPGEEPRSLQDTLMAEALRGRDSQSLEPGSGLRPVVARASPGIPREDNDRVPRGRPGNARSGWTHRVTPQ
jgi:polyphosphate kinase